jgi:hypothetical protein
MDMTDTAPVANPSSPGDPKDQFKAAFREMVLAALDDSSLDMKGILAKVKQILTAQDKLLGNGVMPDDAGQEQIRLQQQVGQLTAQLEQYQAKEKQAALMQTIEQELTAAGLDKTNPTHVSELFSKQLLACESVDARKALIEDRKALVGTAGRRVQATEQRDGKPRSTPSYTTEEIDPKTFANRLRMPMGVR